MYSNEAVMWGYVGSGEAISEWSGYSGGTNSVAIDSDGSAVTGSSGSDGCDYAGGYTY